MKNEIKFFLIGFGLNLVENLLLLFFYDVQITKNTVIGSAIFGLCVVLLSKIFIKNE